MIEIWDSELSDIACISYTCIPVLQFLKGFPYDDYAKAYIYGLRPSSVRVTTGGIKCDARVGRVTVYVDSCSNITEIEQEIRVAFPFDMDGEELAEIRPPFSEKFDD